MTWKIPDKIRLSGVDVETKYSPTLLVDEERFGEFSTRELVTVLDSGLSEENTKIFYCHETVEAFIHINHQDITDESVKHAIGLLLYQMLNQIVDQVEAEKYMVDEVSEQEKAYIVSEKTVFTIESILQADNLPAHADMFGRHLRKIPLSERSQDAIKNMPEIRNSVLDDVNYAIEHQKDHKEFLLSRNTKDIVMDIVDALRTTTASSGKEEETTDKPKVVCLCGSTRFTREMLIKQWELTKQGYIVLTWCALPDDYYQGEDTAHIGDQEGVKEAIDELHKRKIDLSDKVFVINVEGYIGSSTRSEIDYAVSHGKPVEYLENTKLQQPSPTKE